MENIVVKSNTMKGLFENYKTLLEQRLNHKPLLHIGEDSIRYDFFAALMTTYDLKPYQIELEVPQHKDCFVANQNVNSTRKEKPMIDLVVKNEQISLSVEFGLFRQNSNETSTINKTSRTVKMVNDMLRSSLEAKYNESKGLFICVADNKIIGHKLRSGHLGVFPSDYIIDNEYLLFQSNQKTNNIDSRFLNSFKPLNQKIHAKIIYNEQLNARNIINETRVIIWENEIR